jgi:pimeloyl-ACP methyl ester carboxylesterase
MFEHAEIAGCPIVARRIPGRAADAPPLVFLHEGLGSIGLWRDFPDRVAAATGAPVLIYERFGHGRAGPPTEPRGVDYQHREALEVLPRVLDHFGIARPVLVGHSDGASIALIYAGASGRPVHGLVLEAPHVFVEDITLAGIRATVDIWQSTDLPQRLARHHNDAAALFDAWSGIWLSPPFRDWNIENVLAAITAPTLVIQGQDDEYGTPAQVEAIARQVSGPCRTLLLEACGHTPHRDQADAVVRAVAGFVAALPAAAAAAASTGSQPPPAL